VIKFVRAAVSAAIVIAFLLLIAVVPEVEGGTAARIINGTRVSDTVFAERWTFLVSIGERGVNAQQSQFCDGALIAPTLVLTAAHCAIERESDDDFEVGPNQAAALAGVASLTNWKSGQRIAVKDVFVHPNYSTRGEAYDVAVMRLKSPMTLNANVSTISMVSDAEDSWWGDGAGVPTTSNAVGPRVAGWGNTIAWGRGESYPARLRETLIPIASDQSCAMPFRPGLGDAGFNSTTMFCAGVPDSDGDDTNGTTGIDTCSGDSGGPLVVGDGSGQWRVAGIVSWGLACGARRYGAYSRIAAVRDWVNSIPPTIGGPGGIGAVRNAKQRAIHRTSAIIRWDPPASPTPVARYAIWLEAPDGSLVFMRTTRRRLLEIHGLDPGLRAEIYIGARSTDDSESPLRRLIIRTLR
jgi:secreted trypsin-like serine protease